MNSLMEYIKSKFQQISNIIHNNVFEKVDSRGLDVYRIIYSIILLFDVIQLFYFRHLIFDIEPYSIPYEIDLTYGLVIWMITLIFMIIGYKTNIVKIVNYVLSVIFIGTIVTYEYHVFYLYMGVNFLFLITPIGKSLSVDRFLEVANLKIKPNQTRKIFRLYYYLPIFIGLAFVYLDSILFKAKASMWTDGLGMWLPASLPNIVWVNLSFFMNLKPIVIFLGYFTIFYEFIFLFLMWFKQIRPFLIVIGFGLHLGILILFPIPWFALSTLAVFILLIEPERFAKMLTRKETKVPRIRVFYDEECPLCIRTKNIFEYIDFFGNQIWVPLLSGKNKHEQLKDIKLDELYRNIHSIDNTGQVYTGLKTYTNILKNTLLLYPLYLVVSFPPLTWLGSKIYSYVALNRTTERCTQETCNMPIQFLKPHEQPLIKFPFSLTKVFLITLTSYFIIVQIFVSYTSPLSLDIFNNIPIYNESIIHKRLVKFSYDIEPAHRKLFGITKHGPFDNSHFIGYNHLIGIYYVNDSGEEVRLPILNEDGTPDRYLRGFTWVKWNFRINSPDINLQKLNVGMQDFIRFWAYKNNVDVKNSEFIVKVKEIDSPNGWEKDFLNRQMEKPWQEVGKVGWQNDIFYSNLNKSLLQ